MEIHEEPIANLGEYARVPIAFVVETVLEVRDHDGGLGGLRLHEQRVHEPFAKDYDALAGNAPVDLARRFNLARWGMIVARDEGAFVGGALIAFGGNEVDLLDGRDDVAVLWDLRIVPARRQQGVGSALFAAAEDWAASRGCRWLKIETQNINVPACRFYARQGCVLGAINRFAYPELPNEVQLLWYKDLS